MSFLDDIKEDFKDILGGEFAAKIIFLLNPNWETKGIFDNTYEPIELQENGQEVIGKTARITIFNNERFDEIEDGTILNLYEDQDKTEFSEWKVSGSPDSESEGNSLLTIQKL